MGSTQPGRRGGSHRRHQRERRHFGPRCRTRRAGQPVHGRGRRHGLQPDPRGDRRARRRGVRRGRGPAEHRGRGRDADHVPGLRHDRAGHRGRQLHLAHHRFGHHVRHHLRAACPRRGLHAGEHAGAADRGHREPGRSLQGRVGEQDRRRDRRRRALQSRPRQLPGPGRAGLRGQPRCRLHRRRPPGWDPHPQGVHVQGLRDPDPGLTRPAGARHRRARGRPAHRPDSGRPGHRRLRLPRVRCLRRRAPEVRRQGASNRVL